MSERIVGLPDKYHRLGRHFGIEILQCVSVLSKIPCVDTVLNDVLGKRILLGVYVGIVERFGTLGNAEKPDCLFVSFFREDFFKVGARMVRTMIVDFFRASLIESRDV